MNQLPQRAGVAVVHGSEQHAAGRMSRSSPADDEKKRVLDDDSSGVLVFAVGPAALQKKRGGCTRTLVHLRAIQHAPKDT